MSKVKSVEHTPGPWTVETCLDTRGARNGLYLIQTANKRTTLAKADRHYAGTYGETEANTRLMAAAPDLLTAAWKVLRASNAVGRPCGSTDVDAAIDELTNAIAKAEGR